MREVFERHFAEGEELGAAFAVYLDGEPVVDLWGGVADRHTGRPWERDTPVLAYSCTKAITATALLLLAERGLLDVARAGRGGVAGVRGGRQGARSPSSTCSPTRPGCR